MDDEHHDATNDPSADEHLPVAGELSSDEGTVTNDNPLDEDEQNNVNGFPESNEDEDIEPSDEELTDDPDLEEDEDHIA